MNIAKNTPPRYIGFVKMGSFEPGHTVAGSVVVSWRSERTTESREGTRPVCIVLSTGETVCATAYRGGL